MSGIVKIEVITGTVSYTHLDSFLNRSINSSVQKNIRQKYEASKLVRSFLPRPRNMEWK